MADQERTGPAASASLASDAKTNKAIPSQAPASAAHGADLAAEDDEVVEVDDGNDSALGTDFSDTTSISSSIYKGHVENGRRYQSLREGEYWGPSDEKQFEAQNANHMVHLILDSKQSNNLFFSPIPETGAHILDIGTGNGIWCRDVGDKFPSNFVEGVDLYPPPETWVPPNVKYEVDDILKTWMFAQPFQLIHMRYMLGAFTDEQWRLVYKQAYNNLAPGGWIEQLEPGINFYSDDGTLPADSILAEWGPMFTRLCAKTGKNIDTADTFKSRIEAAGFTNVHEKEYKCPVSEWAKNPIHREAGRFEKLHLLNGMEGMCMFLLTKFGDPEPWSPEEVQVYTMKARKEVENRGCHVYVKMRRVWAQKPLEETKTV